MRSVLFWIAPPLIGAFIGYVTNLIAIKMLFRPLKEVRVLGIRLPFTPGILPRERLKLAESIGRMVETELLTPSVIRERLARMEVHEKIESALDTYTGNLMEKPLADLMDEQGSDGAREFPLNEILGDFINSVVFDSFLEELIRIWAIGKNPSPSEETDSLGFWLKSKVRNFGSMLVPAARDLIKGGIVKQIKNQAQGGPSFYRTIMENIIEKYPGITLGEFLSIGPPKKKKIDSFLADKTTGALDNNIEGALSSVNIHVLVADRINSLDMIRVEKIILDVMAGQLWWINLFGGIIGALIGFVQVLLSIAMNSN